MKTDDPTGEKLMEQLLDAIDDKVFSYYSEHRETLLRMTREGVRPSDLQGENANLLRRMAMFVLSETGTYYNKRERKDQAES